MDVGEQAKDLVRDHDPQASSSALIMMMTPTWRLYENPFYIRPGNNNHDSRPDIINMDGNDSGACALRKFVKALMEPELEGLRSRLEEMRSRIEHERKVRKKAEKTSERLSRELVEERGAREALERMCERLAKEVTDEREAGERLRGEIKEERGMLRVAEVLREERVQMKLAEARAVLEDRIGKLEGKVNGMQEEGSTTTTAVAGGDPQKCSGERDWDPSEKTGNGGEIELSAGDHQGQVKGTGRRPSTEAENPHK